LTGESFEMKVLVASSELLPYVSSGILGESVRNMIVSPHDGIDVEVVVPFYSLIDENKYDIKKTGMGFSVPVGDKFENAEIWKGLHPVSGSTVWFISSKYFERDGLYGNMTGDYPDNSERFVFFARSALELASTITGADMIHCNDWQTSLIPVYLKEVYQKRGELSRMKTVLSIHDIRFQGRFWLYDLHILNLGWDIFSPDKLEFYNDINFLKGGIVYSDSILTVNEEYLETICRGENGCGLEGVIGKYRNKIIPVCENGQNLFLENPVSSTLGKCLSVIYKREFEKNGEGSHPEENIRDIV
jgi:starch synthase